MIEAKSKASTTEQSKYSMSGARIAELDGVRGLAVLMVMAYHGFAYEMIFKSWSGWARAVTALTNFGWLGVDLFFVLSGFLITGILLRTKQEPRALLNFYYRRALRILPLYYAVLLVILLVYDRSGTFVLMSAFFLANVVTLFGVPFIYPPLWSLAVEEHFYLLWPWLVRAVTPAALALIAGAIVIGEPLARAAGFTRGWEVYYFSWFRFDGLAWGALLAVFYQQTQHDRAKLGKLAAVGWVSATVLLLTALPFGLLTRQRLVGAALLYSIAQLFFASLLAFVLAARETRWTGVWRWRWLRRCGDWSYCLYLVHLLLLEVWDGLVQRLDWPVEAVFGQFGRFGVRALAVFPLAFLLAALSFRYFESPLLRGRRFS